MAYLRRALRCCGGVLSGLALTEAPKQAKISRMPLAPTTPTDSLIGARIQRLGELRAINAITHEQAVDLLVAYAGGALTRHGAQLQLTAHRSAATRFAAVDPANTVRVAGPGNARDFARRDLRNLRRAA